MYNEMLVIEYTNGQGYSDVTCKKHYTNSTIPFNMKTTKMQAVDLGLFLYEEDGEDTHTTLIIPDFWARYLRVWPLEGYVEVVEEEEWLEARKKTDDEVDETTSFIWVDDEDSDDVFMVIDTAAIDYEPLNEFK